MSQWNFGPFFGGGILIQSQQQVPKITGKASPIVDPNRAKMATITAIVEKKFILDST